MEELLGLIGQYGRNCETLGYMDDLKYDDPLWIEAASARLESWTKITQSLRENLTKQGD